VADGLECMAGREAVCLTLETSIDLEGNARPGRLVADGKSLILSNGRPDSQRHWRLEEIDGFRVQPAIGSCFIQGRLAGQWTDLLRRPGAADARLTEWIAHLNAQARLSRSAEDSGRLADARQSVLSSGSAAGQPAHTSNALPKRMAAQLFSLLRPFYGSVLLLLGLSAAAVGIEVVPPLLQGMLVDRVLKTDAAKNPPEQLLFLLAAIVTGLLLVRLAGTLVGVWKGYISSHVGTAMTADLRNALVEKLNALPLAFHDRNQVGVLMSQVAYDTETLHTLIYHMTSGLLLQSLQLVGISVAMFYLNAKLALITLMPMPLILAGSWYFTRYLQPRQHHYWEAVGKQASALMGMLSGMRVVKAFVQEQREIRRFCQSSRRLRDSRLAVDVSTSTFTAAMGLLFAMGGLAVWYIGGRDVLFGRMTLGSLMAFFGYLAMFYAPLTSIAESTSWFASFFGTSRRMCDVLAVPSEAAASPSAMALGRIRGQVELEHVSFGYDKSRPVLKDLSFMIRPGQMVGVVGRSGSGKSTLVSLIGRLYEADAGQIRIDGIDVRQLSPQDLRRQIGMVPQDPFLFRGSVAENIAYGNAGASPEQILLAAHHADAHDFVMRMPFAYSTQLREGGSGLSGGERQRLSIARALLFDPAILILDEATSSVDAESERAIRNTILRWTRRRTALVISHRLSTLGGADHLLVFDEGRLVEQGTEEELLAQGGIYSTLVSIQGNLSDIRQRLETAVGTSAASGAGPVVASAVGEEENLFPPVSPAAEEGHVAFDLSEKQDSGDGDDQDGPGLPWMQPGAAVIEADQQDTLRLTIRGECLRGVYAVRAFPTSYERQYLGLRCREPSGRERDVGMIATLDRWPRAAQEAVERSLRRRYLLRCIREIRQLRTSENVLALSVSTDGGPAAIRLEKPGEGSQPFGPNGLLLTDSTGNYFVIPDRNALPKRQQRLLALYFGD
jgi:ATP-binding cassette subfamily B protein